MPPSNLVRHTSRNISLRSRTMPTRKRATTPTRRSKTADAPAPAYFLSLTVENVRCFGSPAQTLDLSDGNGRPAQWTIILGDNGVGKTTLLRSIAVLMPYVTSFMNDLSPVETSIAWYVMENKHALEWQPKRNIGAVDSSSISSGHSVGARLTEDKRVARGGFFIEWSYSRERQGAVGGSDFPAEIFCVSYGAARRMSETSLSEKSISSSSASLFTDTVDLMNAEEWLLRADYAASKSSKSQKHATVRRDQIREVLLKVLPEDEVRGIRFTDKGWQLGVDFRTPYGWVRLYDLSLGYRTLIAWMVDFASRMFNRYPDSPNPLAEPAVCLVDEIDLHLHPTWQRKLIGYLTELFPNTQFIVTAHSPLIVQAATDANIVVLRREGDHVVIDNSVESLKGWSVDQILTSDLYGLVSERPPEFDEVIAERQKLLSKPELMTKDKRRLRTLEAKVEELPVGSTPQEIEAFDVVRRFAADLERKGRERITQDDAVKEAGAGKKRNTKGTPRKKPAAKSGAKRTR